MRVSKEMRTKWQTKISTLHLLHSLKVRTCLVVFLLQMRRKSSAQPVQFFTIAPNTGWRDRVRTNWIGWQVAFFQKNPAFELITPEPNAYSMLPRYKLRSGASSQLIFDNIGYADAAIASYAIFSQLKQTGIHPDALSLPG